MAEYGADFTFDFCPCAYSHRLPMHLVSQINTASRPPPHRLSHDVSMPVATLRTWFNSSKTAEQSHSCAICQSKLSSSSWQVTITATGQHESELSPIESPTHYQVTDKLFDGVGCRDIIHTFSKWFNAFPHLVDTSTNATRQPRR